MRLIRRRPSITNALEIEEKLKGDFRVFLGVIWDYLNLPDPTPVQYDIAQFLQHGPKRQIIQAFRGVGKSWITSAFVLWQLYKNPQLKIMVVSASETRANDFSIFCKRLITQVPFLSHLAPSPDQRTRNDGWDVGPATPDHSPSVKSVGIGGMLTGSRADAIIADDIEIPKNSETQLMRDKLSELVKEFDAVLKPLDTARIIYLGTPQTEDSLYVKIQDRGYITRIWPAEMPTDSDMVKYGDTLAPIVPKMGLKSGEPTDPKRFNTDDLIERKASYGKAGYSLQFMLNTQLSDEEKYPLKLRDLIVTPIDRERMPMTWTWSPHPDRTVDELPNVGMRGDKFYWPKDSGDLSAKFQGTCMVIDPSGRGADETGYAITSFLNGYIYVHKCGGLEGGYDQEKVLTPLALLAKEYEVNEIITESNFGDGMFNQLFQPVLLKIHKCALSEVRHHTQKERRIADTLEPLMGRHRLIVDPQVIHDDYKSIQKYEQDRRLSKSLVYQMTRLTRERGCLRHDDRIDALAMACSHWTDRISQDEKRGEEEVRQQQIDKELEKAYAHFGIASGVSGVNWISSSLRGT